MERRAARARDARIGVRVSAQDQLEIEETARARGYSNPSAFIRTAIRNELHGREELTGIEERICGSLELIERKLPSQQGAAGAIRLGGRTLQNGSHLCTRTTC
jgi:metal-responsive CopG/Arc/MetJ family transcriptional regulator